jgi:Flp pilus assembly protein TadG
VRARKRHRSGESGQALLELALVAPILILLLAGLVQFAFIFERQIGITNATREAARRAATFETPDAATAQANADWALAQLQTLLGNSQTHDATRDRIEVCIFTPLAPDNVDVAGNAQVVVRITEQYRHPVFLPIVAQILDGIDGVIDQSLLASTSSLFRVEQTGSHDLGVGVHARNYADSSDCVR